MRSLSNTPEVLDGNPEGASRPVREPPGRASLGRWAWAAAGAAIAAALVWFTLPVLGGSYTEGFESTIAINARELVAGQINRVDLLYPFSGRFFLVTRLGSEIVLGAVGAATGFSGLVSFRLVMLASLLVLVGSVVHVLARRYRVHPLFGGLACLLFPPIFESAYFFNDNVLSAALSSLALAVFWRSRLTLPLTAVAALLLGLAVATRLDAAFVSLAFAALLWFELPDWRSRIRHALVAAPIVALVPVAVYAAYGISFFEIFQIVPRAVALWDREFAAGTWIGHVLNGLSLPGLIAAPLGLLSFLLRRQWREVVLCAVVPVAYLIAYGNSLYELRYLLPLAPFVAIAIVEGGRVVLRSTGLQRRALQLAFAAAFAACVIPPLELPYWRLNSDRDGPRPFVGRLWSPAAWSWWTGIMNDAIAALEGAVEQDARPGETTVIVSGFWNADRLAHLILLEHGFEQRAYAGPPECHTLVQQFVRGDAAVLHVRTHIPLVRGQMEAITWLDAGLPCLRAAGLDRKPVLFVEWGNIDLRASNGKSGTSPTDLYQPTFRGIGTWADPVVGRLGSYSVARLAVSDVAERLRQPMTAEELRLSSDLTERRAVLMP